MYQPCSCDPYFRCHHRPHGWVPPPRPPGYHHAGPPSRPGYQHAGPPTYNVHQQHYPGSQYVPPPPGPGQVIPDWALPQCGHNSQYHGCSHCSGWQWRHHRH